MERTAKSSSCAPRDKPQEEFGKKLTGKKNESSHEVDLRNLGSKESSRITWKKKRWGRELSWRKLGAWTWEGQGGEKRSGMWGEDTREKSTEEKRIVIEGLPGEGMAIF